jgi:hypothetical protein
MIPTTLFRVSCEAKRAKKAAFTVVTVLVLAHAGFLLSFFNTPAGGEASVKATIEVHSVPTPRKVTCSPRIHHRFPATRTK